VVLALARRSEVRIETAESILSFDTGEWTSWWVLVRM
jgi:hypothetical protein